MSYNYNSKFNPCCQFVVGGLENYLNNNASCACSCEGIANAKRAALSYESALYYKYKSRNQYPVKKIF